jgi:hypothetical protein
MRRKRDSKRERKDLGLGKVNLEVVVRDEENLREYEGRVWFEEGYMAKLATWVEKHRYKVLE